jgi:hypothetical protein
MRFWVLAATFAFVCGCELKGPSVDPGEIGTLGIGDACTETNQCRAGLACVGMACSPRRSGLAGSSCSLTADCAEGLYCSGARVCDDAGEAAAGDYCENGGDCQAGLSCTLVGFSGRCEAPVPGNRDLGDACTATNECFAGLSCLPGVSGAPACASPPAVSGNVTLPPSIPFWAGEECETDPGPARAYFDVPRAGVTGDFYRLPFPNDVRRTATGLDLSGHPSPGTVLPVDVIDSYLRASETDLDGFATNPLMYFRFSRPYDWGRIAESLELVDISPESPTYGDRQGLSFLTTNGIITKYICQDWLAVRTPHGEPLRPGTTYAMIVKNLIVPSEGGTFARSSDLTALLTDTPPAGDAALLAAWEKYAPLRAFAATEGGNVDLSTVLNATVFTTQDPERLPRAIREAVRADDVPTVSDLTLCGAGAESPCDDGTPERACGETNDAFHEIHGRIRLPIFQQGTAPYLSSGGGISLDGSGEANATRYEEVCFALTIPKADAMPEAGWPLVLHGHGTGGAFTGAARSIAGEMASGDGVTAPAATLTIDLPQHGERKAGSTLDSDVLFYNFANPAAARGNILQGTADLVSLVHFAMGATLDETDSPIASAIRFDGSRISMFAHSQGSTHASMMIAYESDLEAVVLSGNGGDLVQSLLNKTEPIDIAGLFPFALLDADSSGNLNGGEFHPVLGIFQAYFEATDPVNFGRRVVRSPVEGSTGLHTFMTYGMGDTYSPEATMKAYAASVGFAHVMPVLTSLGLNEVPPGLMANATFGGTQRTIGIRQYAPDSGDDGHFVATRTTQGRADTLRFLRAVSAGQIPSIGDGL